MDDDLLKSLFLRTRDHYESAVRWAFVVALLLLLFHLMIFSQFVRFGKQLSSVQAERIRLSSVEPMVMNLKMNLDHLEESAIKALKARLDGMLIDLRNAFDALDRSVAEVRTSVTSQFTTATAEALLREEPQPSMAIQRAPAHTSTRDIFELDESLKSGIHSAKNIEELRKVLLPFIEEEIVRPRFDQLNSYWHDKVLPDITQQVEALLKEVQKSKPVFPEGMVLWDEIHHSAEQAVSAAAALKFQPPIDPDWWASVSGKQARLSGIAQAAADQLHAILASEAIANLSNQVRTALAQQEKLQDTLQEQLKRFEENFNKQQSKLAALGKPFEVLSLDINVVASRFPLLLGIVLAAITIWPAHRLRELAWTVDLMANRSQEKLLWEWFFGQTWFAFVGPQAAESGESLRRRAWLENWPWMLASLCRCIVYWGWIGLAAWALAGWGEVDPTRSAMLTVGGCLAVAAAQGYRWHVIRQVQAISKSVLPHAEVQLVRP